MRDLDSMLTDIDPMPSSTTPAATSAIGTGILNRVLERAHHDGGAAALRWDHFVPNHRDWWRSPRRMAVVGLVIAVSLALVIVPLAVSNHNAERPLGGTNPPPYSRAPWPYTTFASGNVSPEDALLVGGPSTAYYVLGLRTSRCLDRCPEEIVRFDTQTGALAIGPQVSSGSYLLAVGAGAVLLTHNGPTPGPLASQRWSFRSVNTKNLTLGPAVQLPFLNDVNVSLRSTTDGVAGSKSVWMNATSGLDLVNTTTGKIDHTVHFSAGQVHEGFSDQLALSPNGLVLYALGHAATSGGPSRLEELHAANGRLLASRTLAGGESYSAFKGTNGGVWLVIAHRAVRFLSAEGLSPVQLTSNALPRDGKVPANLPSTTRGFTLYDLGRFVLIESYRGMTCVAPNVGALRAEDSWPPGKAPRWTPFAVLSDSLLATQFVNGKDEVLVVRIPTRCIAP
jgi:hypothetical protein